MFDPVGKDFAPREHGQFSVRTDFSKHRMNGDVMGMPGSNNHRQQLVARKGPRQPARGVKRNGHEYAMENTFVSGALALLVLAYPAPASATQSGHASQDGARSAPNAAR
jgi:hypothetical protein